MSIVQEGSMKSTLNKAENVFVQVTKIKLVKENYLHWAAAITMGIANIGCIEYINGKRKLPNENSPTWNLW